MRSTRGGFSLIELLISTGIIALILLMGMSSMHNTTARAGVQGLTMEVAEEMRSARELAQASGEPTAVVFRASNGVSSGYYYLQGQNLPVVIRKQNYEKSYPGFGFFVGTWPSSGGSWGLAPALPGNKWANFSIAKWLGTSGYAAASDYVFCFLPDGTVRTNDLPMMAADGCFHVIVTAGVGGTSSASAPGASPPGGSSAMTSGSPPSYYQLTSSGDAWTISVSETGAVATASGIPQVASGVTSAAQLSTGFSAPALPPLNSSDTTNPHPIQPPSVVPAVNPGSSPPAGVSSEITVNEHVSLRSIDRSTSGLPLYCSWVTTTTSAAGIGNYSYEGSGGRMVWDPTIVDDQGYPGCWACDWQWRPPPTAQPGDTFTLTCQVQNQNTGGVTVLVPVTQVKIKLPGNVFFESNRTDLGGVAPSVWSMDSNDGSNQQPYLLGVSQPTASIDGSRVCYVDANNNLWVIYPHVAKSAGVNPLQLTTGGGVSAPAMSPLGNMVAFNYNNDLYVMPAYKSSPVSLPSGATHVAAIPWPAGNSDGSFGARPGTEKFTWKPDGTVLVYAASNKLNAVSAAVSGSSPPSVTVGAPVTVASSTPGAQPGAPLWSPSWGTAGGGTLYYANNFGLANGALPEYDPYLFWSPASSATAALPAPFPVSGSSLFIDYGWEDTLVERDPSGSAWVMEVGQVIPSGGITTDGGQIWMMNTAMGSPTGYTLPGTAAEGVPPGLPPTTSTTICWPMTASAAGTYCSRPVWTK